jgi:hypothetical protein
MADIINFKPRKPCDGDYYDPIIRALEELPPDDRLSVIVMACSDSDAKELARYAAYLLGQAVFPEVKKGLDDRDGRNSGC